MLAIKHSVVELDKLQIAQSRLSPTSTMLLSWSKCLPGCSLVGLLITYAGLPCRGDCLPLCAVYVYLPAVLGSVL